MKQTDIAMLILIISLSLVFSFFVGNAVFGGESNRSTEVEVVEPITAEFPDPDENIFNAKSINPTQTINIGGSKSTDPFTSDN